MDMDVFRAKVNWHIDNPPWKQTAPKKQEELPMSAVEKITKFITDFVGPIGSDAKDIRQQLTGGRDRGEYPGWAQLGKNAAGKNLTVVDALAAIRQALARIETRLDNLEKEKSNG